MNHIAFWITGGFFFAVAVAGVAYACLQILSWIFSGLLELTLGIAALIWHRQWDAFDADDLIGAFSVALALAVMICFYIGAIQP